MIRRLSAVLLLLALGGCAGMPLRTGVTPRPAKMDFVVIGDTPYDAVDETMLATAVPMVKALNPPFVLHVGDTQSGGEICGEAADARTRKLFADLQPIPVFYAVGDNEWTDCDRKIDPTSAKPFSELQRLDLIRHMFFSRPAVTAAAWNYLQQPDMPENARFDYGGLTFVTLNVVGTNNGRDFVKGDDLAVAGRAADARDVHDVDWLKAAFDHARLVKAQGVVIVMQADMTGNTKPEARGILCTDVAVDDTRVCDGFLSIRKALIDQAAAYGKPVVFIHGDTSPYTLWRGIEGQDTGNLWELNAAGDAGVKNGVLHGVRDVTHVWIDLSSPQPVRAEGLTTGVKPDGAHP